MGSSAAKAWGLTSHGRGVGQPPGASTEALTAVQALQGRLGQSSPTRPSWAWCVLLWVSQLLLLPLPTPVPASQGSAVWLISQIII